MTQLTKKYVLVPAGAVDENQYVIPVTFVDENGDPADLGGGDEPASIAWADVQGKPQTYPPTIGTTPSTAKAGNYQPRAADVSDATSVGRNVLTAADAAAARQAIGAGTSNVSLPATASAAELSAGSLTSTRMVTPKLIHDEIARQIAAAAE